MALASKPKKFDRVHYKNNGREYDIRVPYDIEHLPELNQHYKNIFRLFYWKSIGKTKLEIKNILQVSEKFIEKNWNIHPSDLQPPRSVSPYVRGYELSLLELYFEPFKPVQIIRNFARKSGLFNILKKQIPWVPAVLRKRNHVSGEITVMENKKVGKRMNASFRYLRTGISSLDVHLENVKQALSIYDPEAYVLCNYYENGKSTIGSHQHDFWSAILSFGASRVMLVEKQPVVLHDGDLIVLGTHKHAIPKQPQIRQGRVSVAIFYSPEKGLIYGDEGKEEDIKIEEDFNFSNDNDNISDFARDFYQENNFIESFLTESQQIQQSYDDTNRMMNPKMGEIEENLICTKQNDEKNENKLYNIIKDTHEEEIFVDHVVPPESEFDLGDDPLSALYNQAEPNEKTEIETHPIDEDEALALALYLSQMETNI